MNNYNHPLCSQKAKENLISAITKDQSDKVRFFKGIRNSFLAFIVALNVLSISTKAQPMLPVALHDSLWAAWNDTQNTDLDRMKALDYLIWKGYLFVKPDSAYFLTEKLFDFAKEKDNKVTMAAALSLQGVIFALQGNFPESLNRSQRCIKLYEEADDKAGVANAHLNIGGIYMYLTDYAMSLEYYQKSLKLFEELDRKKGISDVLGNIGTIYNYQGQYELAIDYQRRSIEISQLIDDIHGMAGGFLSIGNSLMELGKFDLADENLMKSYNMFKELGDINGLAHVYTSLGLVNVKSNNFKQAISYCEKGLKLAEEIAVFVVQKDACECLYSAHKSLGNSNLALGFHEKMLALRDSTFNEETTKKMTRLEMQYDFDIKEAEIKAEQDKQNAVAALEIKRQKLVRNGFMGGFTVVLFFAGIVFVQRNKISNEKKRSDELLLNILPEETAQELKAKGSADAKLIDHVTVLFTDFKGFTAISETLSPKELVHDLNICFSEFDRIMEKYGIEKIKTIGDSYMAAGGLPTPNETHATDAIKAAREIAQFVEDGKQRKIAAGLPYFEIRIGIHTGSVVAGIVGIKKFAYDIWGDTVNTASRMESSSEIGRINISETTYELVKDQFECEYRGEIEAKGKGMVKMYFVV